LGFVLANQLMPSQWESLRNLAARCTCCIHHKYTLDARKTWNHRGRVPKVDKLMAAKETLGKTLWKLVEVVGKLWGRGHNARKWRHKPGLKEKGG